MINQKHKLIPLCFFLFSLSIYLLTFYMAYMPSWSDENIHLYVAKAFAKGSILYSDIHTARPPFVIYFPALFFLFKFPPLLVARTCVILAMLGTALVIYIQGKRIWGIEKTLAILGFFFMLPGLMARSSYTGIELLTFFLTATFLFALREQFLWAGIFAAGALLSGQHGILILVGLAIFILWKYSAKKLVNFVLPALSIPLLVMTLIYLSGGKDIWDDLILKHLYHFFDVSSGIQVSKNTQIDWWLTTWFLEQFVAFILIYWALKNKEKGSFLFTALILLQFMVVFFMKDGQVLYIHPIYPLLCILAGLGFLNIKKLIPYPLILLVLLTFSAWFMASSLFSKRDEISYSIEPHLRSLEMFNKTSPRVAEEISLSIKQDSPNIKDRKIFGHPTLVNWLALQVDGTIAGGFSDFDPLWIKQGTLSRREVVEKIEKDKVKYFISPNWFFTNDPFFKSYLEHCYELPHIFQRVQGRGEGIPRIFLFKRKEQVNCDQF